jgi:hypothetical protein
LSVSSVLEAASRRAFPLVFGLLVVSCAHLAEESDDRAANDPGAGVESASRFAGEPARETSALAALIPTHEAFDLRLEPLDETSNHERYRLSAATYSEVLHEFKTIEGEYYRSRRIAGGGPGPLILISPILGGDATDYIECHIFARWAASLGISAFFLYQDRSLLSPDRDGLGLEALLRELVRDNIKTLRLLLGRPEVDPRRLGTLGISLGAIRNLLIMAAEPGLRANIVVMGGIDLASILLESREPGVLRYFRRRTRSEGITREQACDDIRRHLWSEPGRLAGLIDPARVILFLARFDDKVPLKYGQMLREALGNPQTHILPGGHYTAMVFAPYAASKGFAYMLDRFEAAIAPAQ